MDFPFFLFKGASMKLVVIGNTSLISSASLEQHEHSVELIVNTYQRWPHWHYVGTSIELDHQQPHLHQCGAFDFFPVREDSEEEIGDKATLVIVAESDADKAKYSQLDKDQLVTVWLKHDSDFPVVQIAAFRQES
jgi:hypothetical protein